MNRVATKNAENLFKHIGVRTRCLRRAHVRRAPQNVIWIQHTAPSAKSRLWLATTSGKVSLGDTFETVTYAVLWLCGLVAIGLCWI
jgi:hypothetical protein